MKNTSKIILGISAKLFKAIANFFEHFTYFILKDLHKTGSRYCYVTDYYKKTNPVFIEVNNPTNKTLNAVLFGNNEFINHKNFGSDEGIEIKSFDGVDYKELLQQSAVQPFDTSLIRVNSTNASQVVQNFRIESIDKNNQPCNTPLITQSYFSANQFQSGIIDIPYKININGDTSISTKILANTKVYYTFYQEPKKTFKEKLIIKLDLLYSVFLRILYILLFSSIIAFLLKKTFFN